MKKIYLFLIMCLIIFSSCKHNKIEEMATISNSSSEDISEETKETEVEIIKTSDENDFYYTGDNEYLKLLTDYMIENNGFERKDTVLIPSPVVVKVDENDSHNIKVYGSFNIFGYEVDGDTLLSVNGGHYPGCAYYMKDEKGLHILEVDVAEDGNRYDSSLLEICEGDEELAAQVTKAADSSTDEYKKARRDFIKMYVDEYSLDINYYKDYGFRRVSIRDDIEITEDENKFYDAIDIIERDIIYKNETDLFCSLESDYNERIVTIKMWKDGISKIKNISKTDSGYEDYMNAWSDLKLSIVQNGATILDIFTNLGIEDVTIVNNFVSDEDYETLFISARNGVIVYDILSEK